MVSKEEFLNWFVKEQNRRRQNKITKEALVEKDNSIALRNRRKRAYLKYWRRHKDERL